MGKIVRKQIVRKVMVIGSVTAAIAFAVALGAGVVPFEAAQTAEAFSNLDGTKWFPPM